ncbi:MAG: GldG family protein [Planctomycetes bacterium]|nr:GldG family protein [Planctomycetota bacterium]
MEPTKRTDAPEEVAFTRRRRLLIWANAVLMSAFFLGFLVAVNVISDARFTRFDMTAEKLWEISDHARKVVEGLKHDVVIYTTPLTVGPAVSQNRSLPNAWNQVSRLLFELSAINPRLNVVPFAAGTESEQVLRMNFTGLTDNCLYFLVKKDREQAARKVMPIYELYEGNFQTGEILKFHAESKVISAIVQLTSDRPRKVYYTEGHKELPPPSQEGRGMSFLTSRLGDLDHVEFKPLDLGQARSVPRDADLVFIAGPARDFDPPEIDALREYWNGGGRIFLAVQPLTPDPMKLLRDFIDECGARIHRDIVLDTRRELQAPQYLRITAFGYHMINQGMLNVGFRMVSSGSVDPAPKSPRQKAISLMQAGQWAYAETDLRPGARIQHDTGEKMGDVSVAAAAEEEISNPTDPSRPTARLVVWGGVAALTNQFNTIYGTANLETLDYIANTFRWLMEVEQRIADPIQPRSFKMKPLKLTPESKSVIGWVSIVGLPLLGVVLGVMAWFFRRK